MLTSRSALTSSLFDDSVVAAEPPSGKYLATPWNNNWGPLSKSRRELRVPAGKSLAAY